jgi:hypothetical protein
MKNEQVSELIIHSNELSLNDFCRKAIGAIGPSPLEVLAINKKVSTLKNDGNKSRAEVLEVFLELSKKELLPNIDGHLSINAILEKADDISRDRLIYIIDNDDEPGPFELTYYCNEKKDGQEEKLVVDHDNVHIIAPLQEGEMIIASTDAPGHFYSLDDDGFPYVLASNLDAFLKALVTLSMIKNDDIFNRVADHLVSHGEYPISTGLGVTHRLIEVAECLKKNMNLSPKSEKRYNELWQQISRAKTPNVDVSENRLIAMLDSIYGSPGS